MSARTEPRSIQPSSAARARRFGRGSWPALLTVIALVLVALAIPSGTAQAASHKRTTALSVKVPATVPLGVHPVVSIRFTSGGKPVRGQLISVHLGAKVTQQVRTAADGTAKAEITRDLPAGSHSVTATFAGTARYYSTASKKATFTVTPVELKIATVPPTAGIPLLRVGGGAPLKTGADGTLVVKMTRVGRVALKLALPADDATRQIRLDRWDDGSTDPTRTIRVPDTLNAVIGLQILHPVSFEYLTSDGAPIAPAEVPVIGVSDDTGKQQDLNGPGPHWLRSNSITRLTTGLSSSLVDYRITDVPLGKINAVNRGQQRFSASEPQTIKVGLLVFNLVVQGRDALLKTPTGSQVTITYPGGDKHVLTLDKAGSATKSLSRGEYLIAIDGGLGIPISTPVALSRDQQADVLIFSALDMALVGGVGLILVAGLILLGRPHVFRRRRRQATDTSDGPGPPLPQWPEPVAARDWRQRPKP